MADLHGVPHLVRYVELVCVEEEEDEVHLLGEPLQHLHVVVPAAVCTTEKKMLCYFPV